MAAPAPSQRAGRHDHWRHRAEGFRELRQTTTLPGACQVLDHLGRVCDEMARATTEQPAPPPPRERGWIHPNEVAREAGTERWLSREVAYRAIAERCESADERRIWLDIAGRCAELADYLART